MKLRIEVFSHYSDDGKPKCTDCLMCDIRVLTIDHEAGGGRKHRASLGNQNGGGRFWRYLRDSGYPSGYRVLCFSCNTGRELKSRPFSEYM